MKKVLLKSEKGAIVSSDFGMLPFSGVATDLEFNTLANSKALCDILGLDYMIDKYAAINDQNRPSEIALQIMNRGTEFDEDLLDYLRGNPTVTLLVFDKPVS